MKSIQTSLTQTSRANAESPPLWFLALSVAVSVIGMTLLTPSIPTIKEHFGSGESATQQLLTTYLVALAVGQLVYGSISDRFGRRPVLLFGALLFTASGALAVFSTSIESLVVFRAIQGFGAAACMSMSRAIVNDCFERQAAARAMSSIASILAVAPVLSMAFGGFLAEHIGWKGIMLLTASGGLMVFYLTHTRVSETNLQKVPSINPAALGHAYTSVLRNPVFCGFAFTSGMQVGMFFAMNGFMPYQFERHGYSATEFGLWFSLTSVFYLIGNNVNRLYLVSRGIERAAMAGCILSLVSVLSLLATQWAGMTSALSLALPCMLFGFANGIVIANTTIGAISAAGKHGGTGTGLAGAWQMATGGISGAIIVALGGASYFTIGAAGLCVMSILSTLSMLWIFNHRPET